MESLTDFDHGVDIQVNDVVRRRRQNDSHIFVKHFLSVGKEELDQLHQLGCNNALHFWVHGFLSDLKHRLELQVLEDIVLDQEK